MFANMDDVRARAARRLPRVFFEYIDGAAFSEETARRNISDFQRIELRQRVLRDVSERSLAGPLLGKERSMPLALGPVGFSGLFEADGEIAAARAAHTNGLPYCLSTFGITSLRRLREKTDGALWFQLYVLTDRELATEMIQAAIDADVEALVLTVDTPVHGIREKDIRNGFRSLTGVTPKLAFALAQRPGWCARILRKGAVPRIGNLDSRPEMGRNALEQAVSIASKVDASMTWEDVDWIRERWPRKLIIKGLTEAEDARSCVAHGADGVVISNHGGRQLDQSRSTIDALPDIVEAVGDSTEILIDGGFRRGSDVYKALALGANGVLLGRAYAYGLAAAGEKGVDAVIAMIRTELDTQMAQTGLTQLREVARHRDEVLRIRAGR